MAARGSTSRSSDAPAKFLPCPDTRSGQFGAPGVLASASIVKRRGTSRRSFASTLRMTARGRKLARSTPALHVLHHDAAVLDVVHLGFLGDAPRLFVADAGL